ncbi:bifunctional precorrin-2 dehydrogenase/sirohydrochlorin ferrochelatase [Litorilinea aerophila]|uniref:precorrin-2 dehydrogenase n=1 Tax=Litorilinea aerophila TaxID=1204385 RepID=A0A540VM17_9CHLR|nr:bifunctional precorrin-2 dehydrogenase/sirohydrochlorin ferrochelatase [Litorilinea aerophila]MCC9074506.1 bifunctional precorrin-2 dehydrogenase/sirohydrochlorin ferrochelatase [Litorilinea aerophila]
MAASVYPIYLTQVDGALAVVVGGGRVATRKVQGLLAVGARVRVVSPALTEALQAWAAADRVEWVARPYTSGDLKGALLAFAATDQRAVNAQVARDAARLGILCNVADAPEEGTFHVPAVARHEGLVVAVGSGGVDPGRSRRIRDEILRWLRERISA